MDASQLESMYNQFNSYIFEHYKFFWELILGVFAIIGVALFFIVKSSIKSGIEKGTEGIGAKVKNLEGIIETQNNKISQLKDLQDKLISNLDKQDVATWSPKVHDKSESAVFENKGDCIITGNVVFYSCELTLRAKNNANHNEEIIIEGLPVPTNLHMFGKALLNYGSRIQTFEIIFGGTNLKLHKHIDNKLVPLTYEDIPEEKTIYVTVMYATAWWRDNEGKPFRSIIDKI